MKTGRIMLIGITTALVIAAVVLTALSPGMLERHAEALRSEGAWEGALRVQDRLVAIFPRSDAARQAVLESASPLTAERPQVIVGHDFMTATGGAAISDSDSHARKVVDQLLRIAPRQRIEMWTGNLFEDAAEIQWFLGEEEQARRSMQRALEVFDDQSRFRADQARVTLVTWESGQQKRLAAAQALLREFDSRQTERVSIDETARLLIIVGDTARELGQAGQAQRAYERAIATIEQAMAESESRLAETAESSRPVETEPEARRVAAHPSYSRARFGLRMIAQSEEQERSELARVTGRIADGSGALEGATLYLMTADVARGYSASRIRNSSLIAHSDANGTFDFGPIPPGRYEVAVGLDTSTAVAFGRSEIPGPFALTAGQTETLVIRFADRIELSEPRGRQEQEAYAPFGLPIAWSEAPGSASYAVELVIMALNEEDAITGWTSVPVAAGLTAPEWRLEAEGLALFQYAPWWSDGDGLFPTAVLGAFSPSSLISVRVIAFDESGAMLTDSEGLVARRGDSYPYVLFTKPGELPDSFTTAIEATRARDYDRAIDAWNIVIEELSASASQRRLAVAAHLALGRLLSRLAPPQRDLARAQEHYRQVYTVAQADQLAIPSRLFDEIRASGALERSDSD